MYFAIIYLLFDDNTVVICYNGVNIYTVGRFMKIYNVLTRNKQDFATINSGDVSIYACGITVNGDAHLGHARQAIVFNMITEYLRHKGNKVTYVRNYTDIDDKIIVQAAEQGMQPLQLSNMRIEATDDIIGRLVTSDADIKPRVSEHIEGIVDFVSTLVSKGNAYAVGSDVYFAVETFDQYGVLSNRKTKDMLSGTRVEVEEGKRSPLDFALWKGVSAGEFGWDSPWGRGRPGWHIECSSMINDLLGKQIDIHGGGKDLVFPHHENEIAQSYCHNDCMLANYWVHNGLITVDGQKMSKSLGNFITISQLLESYHPEVVRMLIMSSHYSSPLEVNKAQLVTTEKHLYHFYSQLDSYRALVAGMDTPDVTKSPLLARFDECMDNDFNISLFISDLFGVFADIDKAKGASKKAMALELIAVLDSVNMVLGLLHLPSGEYVQYVKDKYLQLLNITEDYIAGKIADRAAAKANKDYQLADSIRLELVDSGIALRDTASGTMWDVDFNKAKQED